MLFLWPHLYTVPKCLRDIIGPLKIQSLLRKANFLFDPPEVWIIWFYLLPPIVFSLRVKTSRVGLFSQFSIIPALATCLFLLPPITVLLEPPPLFPLLWSLFLLTLGHSWELTLSLLLTDSVKVIWALQEAAIHPTESPSCGKGLSLCCNPRHSSDRPCSLLETHFDWDCNLLNVPLFIFPPCVSIPIIGVSFWWYPLFMEDSFTSLSYHLFVMPLEIPYCHLFFKDVSFPHSK